MKVLVTGGAGYIGSHTVRQLVKEGHEVTVLDNLVYGHVAALPQSGVNFLEGDLRDPTVLKQAFSGGQDAVIHFAAYAYVGESVTDPLKYYENNLAAPLNLLRAMKEHGCDKFVFSSTCATYGTPETIPISEATIQRPINPYGASKMMLERVLEDCGTAWGLTSVFLRYFNASGCSLDGEIGEDHRPETHLIPRILMAATGEISHVDIFGTDYDTPDGTCIRDYIHVEDLGDAHLKALSYLADGGETTAVNLGTGRGLSVREILKAAEEASGREIPVKFSQRRAGDPARLIADPTKAKQVLNWEPQHSDAETILSTAWQWMKAEHGGRYPDNSTK